MFSKNRPGRGPVGKDGPQRVRITITAADRRRAWIETTLARIETRLRALFPPPKETPEMLQMKAAILGTARHKDPAHVDKTMLTIRASLYAGGAEARAAAIRDPAADSLPLRIAVTLMHLLLLIAVFPVGLAMTVISMVEGMSFRRTAHVTAMTGVALTTALTQSFGLPF